MRYLSGNIALEVPDDWQNRSIISFVASRAPSEFAPNVVITREKIDPLTSVEDYADEQFGITQAEVQGLTIIERQNVFINALPAVQIVQTITAHSLNLQQLQTFVLAETEIFIITCTTTAAAFNQHLPAFKQIAQSFRLENF